MAGGWIGAEAGEAIVAAILARVGTTVALEAAETATVAGGSAVVGGSATGGGVGSLGGPAGTVIGVGVGLVIGAAIDWWMSDRLEAHVTDETYKFLDTVEGQIVDGNGQSPGLRASFEQAAKLADAQQRQAIIDALMEAEMRVFILSGFVVLIVATTACSATCQISSATEAAARELVEVMLREGGGQAAAELAELGGEAAVRELLERAASEGGEELVERVAGYGTRYGPAALKAVERSPSQMIRALDGVSPDLVGPAIRAAAREPEVMARLVASYGKDGLELAARHPGVGARLAEKLGRDGIRIGRELTTDQATTLTRFADEIEALSAGDRNQLLDAMGKAPGSVLDYLETHPKVLLTAGGVTAVLAARDNIFGGAVPSTDQSPPTGLIERIIFGVENKLAGPIKAIFIIVVAGIFCYVAIHLRSVWKLKAVRLKRKATNLTAADRSGNRNARPRA